MEASLDNVLREHIVVVGAGLHGLTVALEAQARNPARQVDIIAQVFATDPAPAAWTTGLSRCFFSSSKNCCADFEKRTWDDVLKASRLPNGFYHSFQLTEYFANKPKEIIQSIPGLQALATSELVSGAKEGTTCQSVSVVPLALASYMQELFFRAGGRTFRGTVRHIDEIVHGGVAAFQRLRDGVPTESGAPPSAVVVCVGLGARFLGGIEDRTLKTVQIPVLKLKLPAVHSGRAFYNEEQSPIFFLVPLGGGIAVMGGGITYDSWVAKPIRSARNDLLALAQSLCPDLVPNHADSLIIWEGLDTFAVRTDGPRIEIMSTYSKDASRNVPVILNYGHGLFDLQCHREVARVVVNLMEGALEQERDVARERATSMVVDPSNAPADSNTSPT